MFQNLYKWIHFKSLRRKHRKKGTDTISFSEAVSNVRNILICLPTNHREFRLARYVLKHLPQNDENHHITFVVKEEFRNQVPVREDDTIVTINDEYRDKTGRFSDEIERSILNSQYHAAADYNITFDYGTALLCIKSGAPLRIGFETPHSDLFFNVEIERNKDKFLLEGAYHSIQKLLAIDKKPE